MKQKTKSITKNLKAKRLGFPAEPQKICTIIYVKHSNGP